MQENNKYSFSRLHLSGKNPLPINIDHTQPWYAFNAYIPLGATKGLHIYLNLKEKCFVWNPRNYDLAWLDYADYSADIEGFLDEGMWLEAYWHKYGKVNQ